MKAQNLTGQRQSYIYISCGICELHLSLCVSAETLLQDMSHETGGSEERLERSRFTAEATSSSEASRKDTGGNVARMEQKINVNKMLIENCGIKSLGRKHNTKTDHKGIR